MVWMFSDELKTEDTVKIRTSGKRKCREDETQIKKRKVGEVTVRFTLFALAITRHMPKPGVEWSVFVAFFLSHFRSPLSSEDDLSVTAQ